ncbi:MAG: restriction endonuclease [Actinobacteria bacterium]|nr:restriction endonuclease [Actinomycetota bacterium]
MLHDDGLDRALAWFRSQAHMEERFAAAIRQSFDEVFDGQRTGRYRIEQLSKVEKTYIGTKVEIVVQDEFGLLRGNRLDYLVDEQEVDSKWSMTSGGWMIPTEAVGELCLCLTADDNASAFQVGIVRASDTRLRVSENKDKKRRLNEAGLSEMTWLVDRGALDENLLLRLDESTRSSILNDSLSGQRRVTELFRLVQRRIVRREVVLTVARQDDGPKRVRDARNGLRAEGVIVLGHQQSHPRIAFELGLDVPPKGSWLSCRVVRDHGEGERTASIAGATWRLARPDDKPEVGPADYS